MQQTYKNVTNKHVDFDGVCVCVREGGGAWVLLILKGARRGKVHVK